MKPEVTLLEMAHSPFCIPIRRALEASAVTVHCREIPNWDRSAIAEVTEGNYYEVPVLLHEDRVIYESAPDAQDIARYVDEHFANGRLFPDHVAGLQDILIRYLESEVELATFRLVDPSYCRELSPVDRCLVIRHKERKFGAGCVERWDADRDLLLAEAEVHCQHFEAMLRNAPFLLGESPVYADFLLYGILGNFTWKGWNQIPSSCPLIEAWNTRMKTYQFPES